MLEGRSSPSDPTLRPVRTTLQTIHAIQLGKRHARPVRSVGVGGLLAFLRD